MKAILLAGLVAARACADPLDARPFAHRFDEAQFARDLPALRAMIADEMVFIPRSGAVEGKRAFIDGYAGPTLRFEPFAITRKTYVQLGDFAAVVGGEALVRGSENGKPFTSHFRYADTFAWRGGRWQVLHVQVTPLP